MKKYASDFRKIARDALRGKWKTAVLTGFLAGLIGACMVSVGSSTSSIRTSAQEVLQVLQSYEQMLLLQAILLIVIGALGIWTIVTLVISGAGKLGYAIFNLKLVDHENAAASDLFSQFGRLGAGFCMNFFVGLFTFLWTLLFVIPGIVKSFSYAMTPYILAEHPDMRARDAIAESRYLMEGNKWRLFCLHFSFIGWYLLCLAPIVIAFGVVYTGAINSFAVFLCILLCGIIATLIGLLFLRPYQEAANAAFYRDISGTAQKALEPADQARAIIDQDHDVPNMAAR